jgi:hypothetical protein
MTNNYSEHRLEICKKCPYNEGFICILCGCDILNKVTIADEFCPKVPKSWDTQANSYKKSEVQSAPVDLGTGGASITGRSSPTPCIPCQSKSR